jgi:hypothetical protein
MDQHYERWSTLAPQGMLLTGLGLSLVTHAGGQRSKGRPAWRWFMSGLLGLIAFNAGLALFGEAIKHRVLYETRIDQ